MIRSKPTVSPTKIIKLFFLFVNGSAKKRTEPRSREYMNNLKKLYDNDTKFSLLHLKLPAGYPALKFLIPMKQANVFYKPVNDLELFFGKFKSQTFPWHYHNTYTLIVVEDGFIEYVLDDRKIIVSAGQIFLVNAFQAHYNSNFHCTYKVFFVPVAFVNTDGCTLYKFKNQVACSNPRAFHELKLLHEMLVSDPSDRNYQEARTMLSKLISHMFSYEAIKIQRDQRFEHVIRYIDGHLSEKLTARNLSEISALSVFHFQRKFKDNIGLTLNAYIQQKRMEESRMLLRSGHGPASAAVASGYFDQSHFHHRFLKMYGLTPKQFASVN